MLTLARRYEVQYKPAMMSNRMSVASWHDQAQRHGRVRKAALALSHAILACLVVVSGGPAYSAEVPDWAADAVWYQIFVSRFCNGNAANDPPGTTPWTHDWLKLAPGEAPPLERALARRRYGGDLQGVIEKLPYLRGLGVNALYLNPVFEARTEHKYDTSDYRHIDPSFGAGEPTEPDDASGALPDEAGGTPTPQETLDPATWKWTASDRVFLELLRRAHECGVRVVIDGVFNHVGEGFWAWRDVQVHGRASKFADWFEVTDWEDGAEGRPVKWNGWAGPGSSMVRVARGTGRDSGSSSRDSGSSTRWAENPFSAPVGTGKDSGSSTQDSGSSSRVSGSSKAGDGLHPEFERHIFDITRRWMDPDGDGDPSDGIDGWRLDVVNDVPHGFWKRWREHVKAINPQAILIGEIWGDASEWLGGDEFDAVMNYQFAVPVTAFLRRESDQSATECVAQLERVLDRHPWPISLAMQNLLDSHDTDRAVSMLANPPRGYDRDSKPDQGSPPYDANEPGEDAYDRLKLAAALQFTWPGAPLIYYGDELGMYGGDDPFDREPMWMGEHANRRPDLIEHYRRLASIRAAHPALRRGRLRILLADDARRVIVFARLLADECIITAVNAGGDPAEIGLLAPANGPLEPLLSAGSEIPTQDGYSMLKLARMSVQIFACRGASAAADR